MKILAAILVGAALAFVGMYLGMRAAGPVTHGYNLGSLSYEVTPARDGNAELIIPRTGLRLQAKVVDAPFLLRIKPRSFSKLGIAKAVGGIRAAALEAKKEIKHDVIWTFVRAFVWALGGGILAAIAAGILMFFLRGLGSAIVAGTVGVVVSVLIIAGSGLWVWKAHYIDALENPTVVAGPHRQTLNLKPLIRKLRDADSFEEVVRDLVPILPQVLAG